MKLPIPNDRTCVSCGSSKTYIDPQGSARWYRTDSGYECSKCHAIKYNKKNQDRILDKTITFKGKKVYLTNSPRTGICSNCSEHTNNRRNSLHHIEYDIDNPLKDTIELCNKCHAKKHGLGVKIQADRRNGKELLCDFCGKRIYIMRCKLKNTHHYCSRECFYSARRTKQLVMCEECGKQVYRWICEINEFKHHFCSRKCMVTWRLSHKWR